MAELACAGCYVTISTYFMEYFLYITARTMSCLIRGMLSESGYNTTWYLFVLSILSAKARDSLGKWALNMAFSTSYVILHSALISSINSGKL